MKSHFSLRPSHLSFLCRFQSCSAFLRQSQRLPIFSVVIVFLSLGSVSVCRCFSYSQSSSAEPITLHCFKLRCCPGHVGSECVYRANRSKRGLARPHRYVTNRGEPTSPASTTGKHTVVGITVCCDDKCLHGTWSHFHPCIDTMMPWQHNQTQARLQAPTPSLNSK